MSSAQNVVPEVGPAEAVELVAGGAVLLDVREDEEWVAGHAPQAVHVSMGEVADRVGELPAGRTIVCVCRVGGRSGAVAEHLRGVGVDAVNLTGGMNAWAEAGQPVVDDAGSPGRVI
jgi:rhodanese-related sulfurtransferase